MLTGLLSGILLGTLIISLSQSECAHGQQRNSEPYGRNEQNAARPTPTPTPNPRETRESRERRSDLRSSRWSRARDNTSPSTRESSTSQTDRPSNTTRDASRNTSVKSFRGDSMSQMLLLNTCKSPMLMLNRNDFSRQKLFDDYRHLCAKTLPCSLSQLLPRENFTTNQKYSKYLSQYFSACKKKDQKQNIQNIKIITTTSANKPKLPIQVSDINLPNCPSLPNTVSCTSLWLQVKNKLGAPSNIDNIMPSDKDACSPWQQLNCCSKLKTLVTKGQLNPSNLVKQNSVAEGDLTAIASYYLADSNSDLKTKTETLNNQLQSLKTVHFKPLIGPTKIHLANEKHNLKVFNSIVLFLIEKMHYSRHEVRKILAPMLRGNTHFSMDLQKNVLIDNIAHDSKTFAEIIQTAQTLKLSDSAKNNLELSADAKFLDEICK